MNITPPPFKKGDRVRHRRFAVIGTVRYVSPVDGEVQLDWDAKTGHFVWYAPEELLPAG